MIYDIYWLEKQHRIYKRPIYAMSYMVSDRTLYEQPDQAYKDLKEAFGDLPDEVKNEIIERMIVTTIEDQAAWLECLFKQYGLNPSAFSALTGVSDSSLTKVIRRERLLPKPYYFAICIYFKFDWDYITESAEALGIAFTEEIQDVIFEAYIKAGKYELNTYVTSVIDTASAIEKNGSRPVKLPPFFTQGYYNTTI